MSNRVVQKKTTLNEGAWSKMLVGTYEKMGTEHRSHFMGSHHFRNFVWALQDAKVSLSESQLDNLEDWADDIQGVVRVGRETIAMLY